MPDDRTYQRRNRKTLLIAVWPLYSCSPCSQRVDLMALKKKPKKATLLIVAIALSLVTLLFESF